MTPMERLRHEAWKASTRHTERSGGDAISGEHADAIVRGLLTALREPTQGQLFTLGLLSGAGPQPRATYVEAWQAMLDSIINGED